MSDKSSPKNEEQLRNNVEDYMNMLVQDCDRVKKYFHHQDIKYAA